MLRSENWNPWTWNRVRTLQPWVGFFQPCCRTPLVDCWRLAQFFARCSRSLAWSWWITSPARAGGMRAGTVGTGGQFAQSHCVLYSWPRTQLWPPTPAEICHERELLNTKWSLVQESEGRREMHRSGGREGERESCTQRAHLSSLGFFFPSFAFSFVFPSLKLLPFLPIHLSVLPVVIWFLWNGGAPPSAATITTAGRDSWQPGPAGFWEGKNAGRAFNESEASSPREKCMQMICTLQKDPG